MDENNQHITFSLSTSSIIRVILILLFLGLLFVIRDIIFILFLSIVFAAGLSPWVDALENRQVPRVLAVVIIYILAIGLFAFATVILIPPMAEQIRDLTSSFPDLYEKIVVGFANLQKFSSDVGVVDSVQRTLNAVNDGLRQLTGGLYNTVSSIFGGFITFLGVMVITFYMLLERNGMKKFITSIAPTQYQPYLIQVLNRVQRKLGDWLRGQLLLSVIIFVVTLIGLLILGVKFALILALVAGLLEFIPFLGPIIAAIPAVFLALGQSSLKALLVLMLYVVIQQLENQIIVPKVMERSVGLNPVTVIISMLVGAKIAGLLGVLLAIPIATVISIFFRDFFDRHRDDEDGELDAANAGP